MNINPTPQQKRSLEKMMKERYKVKDKFYDLKKYVPELLDGVIDEWEKALVARAAALDNLRNDLMTREQTVSEREIFAEKNEDDQTKLLVEEWQALAEQRLELKEMKDTMREIPKSIRCGTFCLILISLKLK